jgi:hypothetical protein
MRLGGAVILGRDKKSVPAMKARRRDTLRQNWSNTAPDKSECIGISMNSSVITRPRTEVDRLRAEVDDHRGPASYVELLSCVEILLDARNIRMETRLRVINTPAPVASGRVADNRVKRGYSRISNASSAVETTLVFRTVSMRRGRIIRAIPPVQLGWPAIVIRTVARAGQEKAPPERGQL